MNQRLSWVDWTHTYIWVWSGLCLKISRKKRVSASVINVYCFHSRTVTWAESVTFSLHHCNGDAMQFSRNHIKLLRLSVELNQNIYLWHIAGRVGLLKDDHAHLWNKRRPIEYELFRLPLTHTVPTTFSLHICVASSLLHLAAFGPYLLSPLLIYRPDYEQHLIAFDMIHLVCESNSPILPVSFISVVSCYPASACSARRGALQKRMNRPTIRLGAGSCGPDEPSRRWADWAHAGGARWNRPNDPCAAAMRLDIKLV